MNIPLLISRRYFLTNKKKRLVHIISLVSFFGICIGTAALILVLSVFNGFENLILGMYNSYDPHIKITSFQGKTFNIDSININNIKNDNIAFIVPTLEEKVLLKYQEKEFISILKGVGKDYDQLVDFDSLIIQGNYINDYENDNVTIVGRGVSYYLSMGVGSLFEKLQVYVPNRKANTLLNIRNSFQTSSLSPVGIFSIQPEIDEKYIITPINFVQNLINKNNNVSSIEIQLHEEKNIIKEQERIKELLGNQFIVLNRLEQQELLYKILKSERLAVFIILTFILIIAAFNIIGSLTMLMLDKRHDILIFRSLGLTQINIQNIFFYKSILTVFSGILFGLFLGFAIGLLQIKYGFIAMNGGAFVVDTYPVIFYFKDFLLVFLTVFIIGALVSFIPSKILTKRLLYD